MDESIHWTENNEPSDESLPHLAMKISASVKHMISFKSKAEEKIEALKEVETKLLADLSDLVQLHDKIMLTL